MHRRLVAALIFAVTLPVAACTHKAPQPPPPASSYPQMPSSSPTPDSTASSSPDNREHAQLLAIQDLYKAEFADETKVLMAGGSMTLPPAIQRRTSGLYQKVVLDSFRQQKRKGQRLQTGGRIVGVAMGKWSQNAVQFRACEDYSQVVSVDRHGAKIRSASGARVVQTYEVLRHRGTWQIDSASGRAVKTFDGAPCNGTWYE